MSLTFPPERLSAALAACLSSLAAARSGGLTDFLRKRKHKQFLRDNPGAVDPDWDGSLDPPPPEPLPIFPWWYYQNVVDIMTSPELRRLIYDCTHPPGCVFYIRVPCFCIAAMMMTQGRLRCGLLPPLRYLCAIVRRNKALKAQRAAAEEAKPEATPKSWLRVYDDSGYHGVFLDKASGKVRVCLPGSLVVHCFLLRLCARANLACSKCKIFSHRVVLTRCLHPTLLL